MIVIDDLSLLDGYQVFNGSQFIAGGMIWQAAGLDLRDATHTAFDSDELPLYAPGLDDFRFSKRFAMLLPERRNPSITGTVEFLIMIPEPSTLTLFLSAAVMLTLRRNSRVYWTCHPPAHLQAHKLL